MPHTLRNDADTLVERKRQDLSRKHQTKNRLFLRNILNGIFILLSLISIIGVILSPAGSRALMASYMIGLVAILIKMVEVMLRMPGIRKEN